MSRPRTIPTPIPPTHQNSPKQAVPTLCSAVLHTIGVGIPKCITHVDIPLMPWCLSCLTDLARTADGVVQPWEQFSLLWYLLNTVRGQCPSPQTSIFQAKLPVGRFVKLYPSITGTTTLCRRGRGYITFAAGRACR